MKSIIQLAAVAAFLFAGTASAELIVVAFDGNECNKEDGPFSGKDCVIVDSAGNDISPYLGKWTSTDDDGETETSGAGSDLGFDWNKMTFYYDKNLAQEVDEDDWEDLFEQKVGGWSYETDDLIRFWTAKAGNAFLLFFYSAGDCGEDGDEWDNPDCLAKAQAVSSGYWDTGLLESDLSHISFFDGNGGIRVPEPGTIALLGLGLIGMGAARRRKVA